MAQVVLEGVGQAVGGAYGAAIGGLIGRGVDQALVAGLEAPRQRGPRLEGLKLQGTSEGAPMAFVLGRARVVGQVIWAARFREDRQTRSGSKGGPRTVGYGYSLSFAVAVCEGEIDGIGRIWADGQPMELTGAAFRIYRGGENQVPDPLIEAIEGKAPAYRGTAYVVFEDLPLGPFGNRIPQLAFEVFRRARGEAPGLEDRLEGVCLIPGAGEFLLATDKVLRREGLTRTVPENVHGGNRSDLSLSLDLLQAQLPNLKRVSLVIGWFGDDLRAEHCKIRPGVEAVDKATEPLAWSVAGLERRQAHLISQTSGGPAYGGTPSDESVRQAVSQLKARGLEVTLYPFVFMDIPAGSSRPSLNGVGEQPAYPWRGRLEGRAGLDAVADVDAVFGSVDGWGLRRLALHYARLAAETGADGLLIGSEMRGLTGTRDADGGFPAVEAFKALAAECRAIVGARVGLSYAADWSEYAGLRAGDEVRFHLDPLWADPNINYVGIDWYPPLGDWRADGGGLDADAFATMHDPGYLSGQIAGGEGYDWFYKDDDDRSSQTRTPIGDGLAGEDWVFRVKDLAGWWGHSHHDRIGGVRASSPTPWIPEMKPIRLVEFGCAAIDRGCNAPNLFLDPKSAESALPPFSTGARDDLIQRRVLEAVLGHFAQNNPVSTVYGGPMLEAADAWCWDARPWPAFPSRTDIWADAQAWRCGHWLNGRLDGETRDLILALVKRGAGTQVEVGTFVGEVHGYVIDRPMAMRDASRPLLGALGLVVVERGDGLALIGEGDVVAALTEAGMALPDEGVSVRVDRTLEAGPAVARVRFIDGARDYQTGSVQVRASAEGDELDLDLPAVCGVGLARTAARRALMVGMDGRRVVALSPLDALRLEVGDDLVVEGVEGVWRVGEIELAEIASATLERTFPMEIEGDDDSPIGPDAVATVGAPFFRIVELPLLPGGEGADQPVAVVAADPWRTMEVRAGASPDALSVRGAVSSPTTVATLLHPIAGGMRHRWDHTQTLTIKVEGRAPESRSTEAVLAGGNAVALETDQGWELIQFRRADLLDHETWRLSGLLRGQQGTERAMSAGASAGAIVVLLDSGLEKMAVATGERNLPLIWRAGPEGVPGGAGVTETQFQLTGAHARPWSPAHLRVKALSGGGFTLSWIPRSRIWGDLWDGDDYPSDPSRFRIRVMDDYRPVRVWEVEAAEGVYSSEDFAADFPHGAPAGVRIAVAQWGEGYGWGEEAVIRL